MENKNIYNLSSSEVLQKFNSNKKGLSSDEASMRLKKDGANKLFKKANWKWLRLAGNQFNDALVWILLVAAGLASFFQEWRDVTIILLIVAINAIIGFFQEFKAEQILDQLKNLTTEKAVVFRDGEKKQVDAQSLVYGDVVFVVSGDRVPADGYILESYDCKINSFIFTGESKPEIKKAKIIQEKEVALADIDNMVFMGETVATGEAVFLVTGIGMQTELGKIANLTQSVQAELTPMQEKMRILGRNVSVLAVFIGILVLVVGQYFQMSLYQNFLFALALAVSVVPEGLPAAISVTFSMGMKKLLKSNILAKRLSAVETLGSVGVICSDKTGTITQNKLTVKKVVVNNQIIELSGNGYAPEGDFLIGGKIVEHQKIENLEWLFKIGTLCNDASLIKKEKRYEILGDPTEGALIVAGKKFNAQKDFYKQEERKITENPFSSDRMRMSVVYKNSNINSFVKGSPDVLLGLCTHKLIGKERSLFLPKEKELVKKIYNQMSAEALRVLAFAYRNLDDIAEQHKQKEISAAKALTGEESIANVLAKEAEKDLVWVGMMAMIDPARSGVKEAIVNCKKLGIKVVMITGDYEVTAAAIARNINLISDDEEYEIINGAKLETLSDKDIFRKIKSKEVLFARIAPEQKLRIASILKANGEIIAMTGDGVNDAPVLKKADIGIAMGIAGTDVSKEVADMILLDDNFISIVKAIKEGRIIFVNLKKFVHYVFTSNASELLTIVFGVILQIPSPITAIQILVTDLGTDILPSFALGFEPEEPGEKKLIKHKQFIMTLAGFRRIMQLGVIMATGAVVAFIWSMLRGGWHFGEDIDVDAMLYIQSTTATYAVISMTQMANLLQSRSERFSPFKLGFFKNKHVIGAMLISFGFLLAFMYVPFFQKYLHMYPIEWQDWLVVAVSFLAVFIFEEARKGEKK